MGTDGTDEVEGYPEAAAEPSGSWLHGRWVPDPYRWLEDATSARTRTWVEAQARLLADRRRSWTVGDRCSALLDDLTRFTHESSPQVAGDRHFSTRREPTEEHPSLVVEEAGRTRVLLDPGAADPSGRTLIGRWSASPDGRWVACQLDSDGREELELVVLDAATGLVVGPVVPDVRYTDVGWVAGRTSFYYARCGPAGEELRLHGLDGSDVGVPAPVECTDEGSQLGIRTSADGRWLVVGTSTGVSAGNVVHVADLHEGTFRPRFRLVPGLEDGWTEAWPGSDGTCFLLTDAGTGRDRILTWDAYHPEQEPRPLVDGPDGAGHPDDAWLLTSFVVLAPRDAPAPVLLVHWRGRDRSRLTRHRLVPGATPDEIALPGPGSPDGLGVASPPGSDAWFSYSDRTTPDAVWHYDDRTRTASPWRSPCSSLGPSTEPPPVAFRRGEVRMDDGAVVGILVTEPAGATSTALPTLVEAYGAFGETSEVEHYAAASAWALLGGRHVVAGVRGGGEQGEAWHRAGCREHKQRGIDDLVGVLEDLVVAGLAPPGGLALYGASAGGLLVAAVATQRPDLVAAVACVAPLTDLARYERSGLGPAWSEELGTAADADELGWLLGYSPYHHVRPGVAYPQVLLCASDDDTRVDPAHARKLCAALQSATTGGDVLLRTESGVGHGERDRTSRLALFVDVLAACWAAVRPGTDGARPSVDHLSGTRRIRRPASPVFSPAGPPGADAEPAVRG